jgi:hypothetical protein
VEASIAALGKIYRRTIFPEMKPTGERIPTTSAT